LGVGQLVATAGRVDAGMVQNLRGVQIADAGHRLLIQQRDLYGPLAAA
jgi:hypothetical protein